MLVGKIVCSWHTPAARGHEMLRLAPTAALARCACEMMEWPNGRLGPIPTDAHRAPHGSLWHIVPCSASEKPTAVPLTVDPGSPGALLTSLEALDVPGGKCPRPTSHPRACSSFGFNVHEPARYVCPGTDEISQNPYKGRLHVHGVSDCASAVPCSPFVRTG